MVSIWNYGLCWQGKRSKKIGYIFRGMPFYTLQSGFCGASKSGSDIGIHSRKGSPRRPWVCKVEVHLPILIIHVMIQPFAFQYYMLFKICFGAWTHVMTWGLSLLDQLSLPYHRARMHLILVTCTIVMTCNALQEQDVALYAWPTSNLCIFRAIMWSPACLSLLQSWRRVSWAWDPAAWRTLMSVRSSLCSTASSTKSSMLPYLVIHIKLTSSSF